MKLYIFNPENDLALANNDPHFIPPRSARRMSADMGLLPVWWMEEGGALWGREGTVEAAGRLLDASMGMCPLPEWVDEASASLLDGVSPWGWSPLLLNRLRQSGIPEELLPSSEWMEEYRRLSGRHTAVRWLAAFRDVWGDVDSFLEAGYCGESVICRGEEDIRRCLSVWPETMLKAPWSGSGKGLRLGACGYVPPLTGWCRRLLLTQGAVAVEPLYNKVLDFGAEFYCDGCGHARYEGISLFQTSRQGAYTGNRLASERSLREVLSGYVPLETVDRAIRFLQQRIGEEVADMYRGYCGVDMMVCRMDGKYVVHPCVEFNLRMTMGMVAICLSRRLAETAEGIFRVVYSGEPDKLCQWSARQLEEAPRQMESGKITGGYWPLTPVDATTAYHAYMEVFPSVI